jgi:hypothetical protein
MIAPSPVVATKGNSRLTTAIYAICSQLQCPPYYIRFFSGPLLAFRNNSGPKASGLVHLCRWNVRDADFVLHNRHLHHGLFLFVTVNRFERNRPLAILLMILLLGVTAAAVLKQLMP